MMLQHFGLREPPFGLTPDTSFAFSSRSHREAHDTVMVALEGGDGFIKITGEVGTGKTFLCRRLLGSLDERYLSLFLPNPCIHRRGLLISLCLELGLDIELNTPQAQLLSEGELRAIEAFLKRRFELTEINRVALAARIAQPIVLKLGINAGQISPEAIIEEVERQRRTRSRYD